MSQAVIDAFIAGRRLKQAHDDAERRRQQEDDERKLRLEAVEVERRRLRLDEKLRAHRFKTEGAQRQFEALQGLVDADMTPAVTDGGVLPARAAVSPGVTPGSDVDARPALGAGDASITTRLAPVQFPGFNDAEFPDFMTGGFNRRPQGMTEIMRGRALEARRQALSTPFALSPGQTRYVPGAAPGTVDAIASRPREVTFGAPQEQLVDGERQLVRPGSDGNVYPIGSSAPLSPERVRPAPRGGQASGAATTTQVRQQQERARNRLNVAMSATNPSAANIAAARRAIEAAGLEWDVEKGLAAQRVEANRLASASRRRSLDTDADDVPDSEAILGAFDAAESAAAPAATPEAPKNGAKAGQGRTATVADIRAVAKRLNITEAEARRQLIAQGVKLSK